MRTVTFIGANCFVGKLFSSLFETNIQSKKIIKNKIDKYVPNIKLAKLNLGSKIKYNL